MPGQVYHLSDGRTVQLVGTVDRADEWVEEDGTRWVRVVDYKTGTKKLNLKEVYCGLDCQMLLYLFSLTRDKSGRFTGAEPAGVLYLLADPAPKTTNRQQAQQDVQYELDGLVRDEQKVFDAMDADETGRYLPLATATVYPAPARRISVPILQSSTASSCIWMILSPRWASSFTMGRSLRNRWWPGRAGTPASGATTALSAATRPASASGHWKPRPNPLSRKRLRTRRKVSRHE